VTFAIVSALTVLVCCVAERFTRHWRVPTYHVEVPAQFDVDEVVGIGKGGEEYRFSPREMYLHYHQYGWEGAKIKWLTGHWSGNGLVQQPLAGHQRLHDGWAQFERETWALL